MLDKLSFYNVLAFFIMQKKSVLFYCIVFAILVFINLSNVFIIQNNLLSGATVTTGSISLTIEGGTKSINITSPQPKNYSFGIGEDYTIDLNVTAINFTPSAWIYNLFDSSHGVYNISNTSFSPDTIFDAVRWDNLITVYAFDEEDVFIDNVSFYVDVPNSAPVIQNIPNEMLACEAESFSYFFNVTDVDEQIIYGDISPKNPFYLLPLEVAPADFKVNYTFEVFSQDLEKEDVGLHEETVSVNDLVYSDYKDFNITVIEVNNPPEVENIGVQTLYSRGDDSTFYKELVINDIEDENLSFGNLSLVTYFSGDELFEINNSGIIDFTANETYLGVHNISICVNDTGIDSVHPNISLCSLSADPATTCSNFSITVTDLNRDPYIETYYPGNLTQNISAIDSLYFNISKYDPDWTIPDAYWYVDDILEEYDTGSSIDEFNYYFGCGSSGNHNVTVEITDGLANDSISWNISVSYVACSSPPPRSTGGGGGGGASPEVCIEKWVVDEWSVCQNARTSFNLAALSSKDFRFINDQCTGYSFDADYCGYQIRDITDVNNCSNYVFINPKPSEIQACYYTVNPSCYDDIKNCHSGACEVLTDCGGPCGPCTTCSDGIQNQGEEGVDCGGPCSKRCPIDSEGLFNVGLYVVLVFFVILLIILIIIMLRKVLERHKQLRLQK